ncbi:Ig-like domain-containing protein [Flavicella sediminum]|uniref:Ig-like domain-containing protein n=1 Tax=Flavicella sediminum TaxID=2585141 RepID=UPI00140B3611|nr:Ig-like domain-containing protein [Flavicella sediminum]
MDKKSAFRTFGKAFVILSLFLGLVITLSFSKNDKNNGTKTYKVHAPFNKKYEEKQLGEILWWEDTERAVGAVGYHKGLLIAPLSFDFGGGMGAGCLAAYNVDDPTSPKKVFDSRNFPNVYHKKGGVDYLGDLGEIHALQFHKDMVLLSDRGDEWNGFVIVDLSGLYDQDPKTNPKVVSRYRFPDIEKSTIYDGFSFSPVWAGGKYVYAPTGSWGFFIIDTGDLKNPKLLAHLTKEQLYDQTLRSVHAIGDLLVLSPAAVRSKKGKLVFVDVSNPSKPNLLNSHPFKTGYQGTLYGNRFYNSGFTRKDGVGKDSLTDIIAYDFSDVMHIKEIVMCTTNKLDKSEYMYLQDDNMFIGDYNGLTRWDVEKDKDKANFAIHIYPQHPPANDYGFVSPLGGNLVVIGSDHSVSSKLNIACHQVESDLKAPEVKSVYPKKGTKGVSPLVKIGISFSDFIDNGCLEHNAVYVKEKGTGKLVKCGFSHGQGIVHAVPMESLKKNRTYSVYITSNLMDMVGNSFEGNSLVTQFSTGDFLSEYDTEVKVDVPREVGTATHIEGIVSFDGAPKKIAYAWDFGDGSAVTSFSEKSSIKKIFKKPGNYSITLLTKAEGTDRVVKATAVQVVHNFLPKTQAATSSTLLLDEKENKMFVVNPDNNTFTCVDTKTNKVMYEEQTGESPVSIAKCKEEIWISCSKSDEIKIHDAASGSLLKTIRLAYGAAPYGIAFNAKTNKIFVALSAVNKIQEIDVIKYELQRSIELYGSLRHIAFLPEKNILVAPQFIAQNQKGAIVQWVDVKKWKVLYQKELIPSLDVDGISNGRGYPNYLGAMAVNPEQNRVWIPAKKDNLFRGLKRDGKPLVFDHTVRSIAVQMDIDTKKELVKDRLDFDNHDFATSATYNAFGNRVYVTTNGSQALFAIDAYNPNNISAFNTYGEGARSIVASRDGNQLYVHNQLSRSISVFNTKPDGDVKFKTKWKIVQKELLAENVLAGKKTFNNTFKSNLSREGYMSCASCHIDGGHDGRIWDLSNLGEGFRNTIDLRGKEGMKHGTLHWSANFDEIQDFDNQIINLNEGTGFLYELLPKKLRKFIPHTSGLHKGLDNLAEYITSLSDYPKSPNKNIDGTYTKSAIKGRQHFIKLACYSCHSGATFTDSGFGTVHNMGTIKSNSGNRLHKKLEGLDTPTLISLWQSAPYLHDGSAKTLEDVFEKGEGAKAQEHRKVGDLSKKEKQELMSFLLELDQEDGITAAELKSKNKKPKFVKERYKADFIYEFQDLKYPIVKVKAFDEDEDQKLTYRIIPSVYSNLFAIDSLTGQVAYIFEEIYLKTIANKVLDSEKQFDIKIMVEDTGAFVRRDTTSLAVHIQFPYLAMSNKEFKRFYVLLIKIKQNKKLSSEELSEYELLKEKSLGYRNNEERWIRTSK